MMACTVPRRGPPCSRFCLRVRVAADSFAASYSASARWMASDSVGSRYASVCSSHSTFRGLHYRV